MKKYTRKTFKLYKFTNFSSLYLSFSFIITPIGDNTDVGSCSQNTVCRILYNIHTLLRSVYRYNTIIFVWLSMTFTSVYYHGRTCTHVRPHSEHIDIQNLNRIDDIWTSNVETLRHEYKQPIQLFCIRFIYYVSSGIV